MAEPPTILSDEIGIALSNLADAATGGLTPTLRLGVTGLSRAGKTIFITALVHDLLTAAPLPGFTPLAEGRLIGARLGEFPDASLPRFAYEDHLRALTGKPPRWPESTRRISAIRIVLRYQSTRWPRSALGATDLNVDIVDYPGEWLLDLPLLTMSYAQWSATALERAHRPASAAEAGAFLAALAGTDAGAPATEAGAEALARTFTDYLRRSREDGRALSALAPGRFLMPGDLEGTPALTFAPLPPLSGVPDGSLYAMLERRYEAYKRIVARPFFRDHFARLDRQIVLVDALRALNAGPEAVADLEAALIEILACFRAGDSNPFLRLIARRIDRILFAATKADHLHHTSHDRLEAVLNRLVADASRRARFAGAKIHSLAIAAVRATREEVQSEAGRSFDLIVGTPEAGEQLDGTVYDGKTEIALFPGELPERPDSLFSAGGPALRFLRFLPPQRLRTTADGAPILPHIRLDRALDYLIGDRLR